MTPEPKNAQNDQRPDFMVTLGLLPPYTVDDVKRAYHAKSLSAHPDRGGDVASFNKLREAYERALTHVEFYVARRSWLGARVSDYIAREEITKEVELRGGCVELEKIGWLRRDLGDDFGQVTDKLVGIHLSGQQVDDTAIESLVRHASGLQTLTLLDLSHSRISDAGLVQLRILRSLRRLDLRGTQVSYRGIKRLLPSLHLQRLHLGGTGVSWLRKLWLRWLFPKIKIH